MEYIIDSVRRIIAHWVATQTPLASNAAPGDTTLHVQSTGRFRTGDEIIIRNPFQGETPVYIDEIIDYTHLSIVDPVKFAWATSEGSIIEKMFYNNMIQGIYIGDPGIIPRFPAITVEASNRTSEWFTIDSTKEVFNIKIHIYVQDANQEASYRFLLHIVDSIQKGLKQNIFPLVAPYNTVALTEDIAVGDNFIKVEDTSIFDKWSHIQIENRWTVIENIIEEVVDGNILRVRNPFCCIFTVADNTQAIKNTRFIWNSWPDNIDYGKVFKGTMLKAATINWFAWEEEIEPTYPRDPTIF